MKKEEIEIELNTINNYLKRLEGMVFTNDMRQYVKNRLRTISELLEE
jgi:hypothetical protein